MVCALGGVRLRPWFACRNPVTFSAILEWYRTGVLQRPPGVSEEQFLADLLYFNVPFDGGRSRVYIWGRGTQL